MRHASDVVLHVTAFSPNILLIVSVVAKWDCNL